MQDVDVAKQAQKRLKRRGYIRKMMQQYRQKEKMEVVFLQSQAEQLELELKHLLNHHNPLAMLPWKEVAAALDTDKQLAMSQKQALADQVTEVQTLIRDMSKWVTAHTSIPTSPSSRPAGWRNISLLGNHTSRVTGKEWITKHMQHNATNMFRQHGFPSLESAPFQDTDVVFSEHHFTFVRRAQYDVPVGFPLELHLRVFHEFLCDALMVNGLSGVSVPTVVEREASTTLHRLITCRNEGVNLLCGRFTDGADRGLVVAQQIQHDDLWPHDLPQRNRMLWFERITLPGGQRSVVRMLYMMGQTQSPRDGYVSLHEEAQEWGGNLQNLPQDMQEVRYRHDSQAYGQLLSAQAVERNRALVAALMAPPPKKQLASDWSTPPRLAK
ncbi:hypothetical protein DYB25_009776 [Aphanomyces astaci]|uniref:Uncharacterized protein n=1 Tax=Aphanomyces astaci TaxID=112090 RepID=A0A397AH07_APHAT|nr:hypothetical protein DYB25_009776 [Aphanomyces astaci]